MAQATGQGAVPTEKTTTTPVVRTTAPPENAVGTGKKAADVARLARWAAVGVLLFYFGVVAFMLFHRADGQWDHMNTLLGGLQAIVFGAAGVLFGTSIQRDSVARATTDADNARKEAEQVRQKAGEAERRAAGGAAMAAVARSRRAEAKRRSDVWGGEYRGGDDDAENRNPDNEEAELQAFYTSLVALADEYFPQPEKAGDGK